MYLCENRHEITLYAGVCCIRLINTKPIIKLSSDAVYSNGIKKGWIVILK